MRSSRPSTSATDGSSAPGLISASSAAPSGSTSSRSGALWGRAAGLRVGEVGDPTLGGVAAFLAAGGFGARFADCFERRACDLVGLGKVVLGGGQPVGIGAARDGGGL